MHHTECGITDINTLGWYIYDFILEENLSDTSTIVIKDMAEDLDIIIGKTFISII